MLAVKKLKRTLSVVCGALLLAAGSVGSLHAQEYVVGEGDILKITVYDHPDLETVVRVGGDGAITFPLIGSVKVMLDAYEAGELDRVYFVVNQFENTMTQKPTIFQLLPLIPAEDEALKEHHWDYLYEPDAKDALTMRPFKACY